jgi:NAD(P)-dependent dehydrogenase (short-subunit alcohol dehydrogenase family)
MAEVRYADMKHKVALVTGAASGIGEACARQFAAQDCRVVMVDRNAERLQALLGELSRSGKTACTVVGDVTEEATSVAGVDRCQSAYGRIDYAVNCAGVVGASASIDQTQLEEWERVLAINLTGVFLGLKHQLKAMIPAGRGSIVNISSGAGLVGIPYLCPYSASKHAVLALTKTAAMEVAPKGLRVNAVLPGSTRTPMVEEAISQGPELERQILGSLPTGRLATADEIAAAVLWLCSEQSSYVNGHSLVADGAFLCR